MDYNSFPPGAHQGFPFNGMSAQHDVRMSQPQPQQGHPPRTSLDPNYFPYESLRFDAPFMSATNGFVYPPLPDPHAPASLDDGQLPDQDLGSNNRLEFMDTSDTGSLKVGDQTRNVRGTSAATSTDEITPSTDRDEKDGTDPQSRRKAQNRAAQRAFRERKEQRVRGLEDELISYKEKYAALEKENEDLKRQIAKLSTENEILKATAHAPCPKNGEDNVEGRVESKASDTTGTQHDSPMEGSEISASNGPIWLNKAMVMDEPNPDPHFLDDEQDAMSVPSRSRVKIDKQTGERYLDASETWEMIVNYRAAHNVMLNLNDIYKRLKGKTKCDGQGAVIAEEVVKRAIQESVESGRDGLL